MLRTTSARRSAPRGVRSTALALAALFLTGQLVGSFHAMLVRHAPCDEHGELVELHPHGGGVAVTVEVDDRAALGADSHTDAEHAHEHCTLAPRRREEVISSGRLDAPARLPVLASFTPRRQGRVLLVQQALFRLAPKNSPPA